MDCCGSHPEIALDDDDFSAGAPDHVSSDVSSHERSGGTNSGTDVSAQLTTPYTRCTPLFRAIEHQDWEGVLLFLNTAKWSNSMWNSTVEHLKSPAPHIQCKTWVVSYKNGGKQEEWSQLPIHAAISYGAPAVVIQKLVETYPASVQQRDGEGMLPVHLAFGFGSNDAVLGFLLRSWPASVTEPGPGGRLPHECCDLGPNKPRGEVFRIVAEQTGLSVQQAHDDLWLRCVVANSERLGLQEQKLHKRHLTDLLTELLEDRAQLQELKEKLKMKYGAASGSASKLLASTPSRGGGLSVKTSPKHSVVASPMSSPRTVSSDKQQLIPSPKGKGSNPPWIAPTSGTSASRATSSPTHRSLLLANNNNNSNSNAHASPTSNAKNVSTTGGLTVHAPKIHSSSSPKATKHPQLALPSKSGSTPKSVKSKKSSVWKRGGSRASKTTVE